MPRPSQELARSRAKQTILSRVERLILVAAAIVAAAASLGLHRLERAQLKRVERLLSDRLGARAAIGDIDAALSGTLIVRDVEVDGLLRVDRMDAGLDVSALTGGDLRIGLLEVHRPRVSLEIDEHGESNLERVLRSARTKGSRAPSRGGPPPPLPHIRVSGGALVVRLGDATRLEAEGVELTPVGDALRLVAGPVEVSRPSLGARGRFERVAADLHPRQSPLVGRAVANGGAFAIGEPEQPDRVDLADLIVSFGVGDVDLTVSGSAVHRRERGELEIAVRRDPGGLLIEADAVRLPLALLSRFEPSLHPEGRTTAKLSLLLGARSRFEISARVEDARIEHPALAMEPFPIDFGVRASGETWSDDSGRHLIVDGASLDRGAIRLSGHGDAAWLRPVSSPTQLRADISLASVGCDDALAALPTVWRRAVAGLDLEGELMGRVQLRYDEASPEAADLEVDVRNRCRATVDPIAAADAVRQAPAVRLDDLPAHVPQAFVAAEDGRFYRHRGFDERQIERSLIANLQAGGIRRGGSTITQQLAKNLFLHQRRTFARKLQEAIITWRLESALSKEQILERYLNIVQLSGDKTVGIGDGARLWFGVSPGRLTLEQAAFLAAITPEPTTMSARIDSAGGLDPTSQHRIDQVLRAMRRDRYITSRELRRAEPGELRLRRARRASR